MNNYFPVVEKVVPHASPYFRDNMDLRPIAQAGKDDIRLLFIYLRT
jgi:hypothetical protein